jgi:hypothetical protein
MQDTEPPWPVAPFATPVPATRWCRPSPGSVEPLPMTAVDGMVHRATGAAPEIAWLARAGSRKERRRGFD